jgi:hypothetical protein|tara:strand:+ start:492 stop:788 length:297 start_codon:yes stop_codon:yes gene_type:complete
MDYRNILLWVVIVAGVILLSLTVYYKTYLPAQEPEKPFCWLWVTDKDKVGFGAETTECERLSSNCESPEHSLDCGWKELRDTEGTKAIGCQCDFGGLE